MSPVLSGGPASFGPLGSWALKSWVEDRFWGLEVFQNPALLDRGFSVNNRTQENICVNFLLPLVSPQLPGGRFIHHMQWAIRTSPFLPRSAPGKSTAFRGYMQTAPTNTLQKPPEQLHLGSQGVSISHSSDTATAASPGIVQKV